MDCVNHPGIAANVYCQNCGKGVCSDCLAAGVMRSAPGGQVLCSSCGGAWQGSQPQFAGVRPGEPNPTAAAVLGLIPGVGAMYNGQFFKAFVHVIVFALLVSFTSAVHGNLDIFFGLMIPAWILYQSFEAFHTARAMREGEPLPDPLNLNEIGARMNLGNRPYPSRQPGAAQNPAAPSGAANNPPPYPNPAQPPGQAPYSQMPFPPYSNCGRGQPVGAIVLIGLGLLFLAGQLDLLHGYIVKFGWPLLLIALGVWLLVRRMGESQGGPK